MQAQEEIEALLKRYFDGLYYGDASLLKAVFHPQVQLIETCMGRLIRTRCKGFSIAVSGRESPHQRGEEFQMEALGIEIMNQVAYVKARCPMLGFNHHDYLSLVHDGERWLITKKLFTHAAD